MRSFECTQFKIFFHLWHGGGPNFWYEYRLWQDEQAAQWSEVSKKTAKISPLSGANREQLGTCRVHRPNFQNHATVAVGRNSVFNRIKPALTPVFNPALKGILGPYPGPSHMHLTYARDPSGNYANNVGPICQSCGRGGHQSGRCHIQPRSSSMAGDVAPASGDRRSLHTGPSIDNAVPFYSSFTDYATKALGISPPIPIVVSWCWTSKVSAPEFDED